MFSFFFFNYTAPAEIYTLSLHDALPILNLLLQRWVEPPVGDLVHGSTFTQQLLSLIAQYGGVSAVDAYTLLCESGPFVQDRKSTRLNSSHSQISYAVFCLKKKKNSFKYK